LLADYFSGKVDLDHVLKSGGRTSTQRQELRVEQVGSVEPEIPGITDTAVAAPVLSKLEAAPPILRPELSTDKKVLTVAEPIAKLNNFQLFLALSDRATRIEGEFLHYPHTTKLIWGSHCIVYIFTDSAGELSLYYDIELKEPLESATTGGAMFPTTTIITKDRTYVPVPSELEPAFRIAEGAKEFYVRFDTIP
jgi:molecular chaperone HtpG